MALPQGPKVPSVLQLLSYTVRPLQFLDACAKQYGEIFTVKLAGYGQFVIVSNTKLVEEIFAADPAVAHSGEANDTLFRPALGARSVLLLDEKPHARQRKLLLPPLHGDRMRAYLTTIRETTFDVIDRWPTSQVVTIDESMREITLRVILQTVFGVNDKEQFQVLTDLIQDMLAETVTPFVLLGPLIPERLRHWSPRWARFLQNVDQLRARLGEIISRSRSSPDLAKRSDVLAILLQARDEDGQPMDDEEICDELTRRADIDPRRMDVRVVDGEVVLEGDVEDAATKSVVEDIAARCGGVIAVVNRLSLDEKESAPAKRPSKKDPRAI